MHGGLIIDAHVAPFRIVVYQIRRHFLLEVQKSMRCAVGAFFLDGPIESLHVGIVIGLPDTGVSVRYAHREKSMREPR